MILRPPRSTLVPYTTLVRSLEQPPTQTSGGGINSTLGVGSISSATPLPAGASVNLHLLFGVQQTGDYHVSIVRSEEHTSELQSRQYLVCRLLLQKRALRTAL